MELRQTKFFFKCLWLLLLLAVPGVHCKNSWTHLTDIITRATDKLETCWKDASGTQSVCPPSMYHSSDGQCNNIIHKFWGGRNDRFLRLMENDYSDGLNQPRRKSRENNEKLLPNTEEVMSYLEMRSNIPMERRGITATLPSWALMLFYDLVGLAEVDTDVKCCQGIGSTNDSSLKLRIPSEEESECFVNSEFENCKEYKRSAAAFSLNGRPCNSGIREQMNMATGYLDGSGLYGSSDEKLKQLRSFNKGKIIIERCSRCMEHGPVGILHKILAEEHNRIADNLSQMNPQWDDNKLFYESRRILIAQIQHITYNEFLPVVLGQEIMHEAQLMLVKENRYKGYSSVNRGGIFNEFAIGAMPAFYSLYAKEMMNSLSSVNKLLNTVVEEKTFLPNNGKGPNSWSLLALFTHMGRDHGVANYGNFSGLCDALLHNKNRTEQENSFSDIPEEKIDLLREIYGNLQDVDLLVGSLVEEPLHGAVFGPSITCMIAIQFLHLRQSDRFWYENDIPPSSFTSAQIHSLRKVTLSGLFCSFAGTRIAQPNAFLKEDAFLNSKLGCDHIPGIDLNPWRVDISSQPAKDTDDENISIKVKPDVILKEIAADVKDEFITDAIKKATDYHIARKRFEYESWLAGKGVDPKSPDGLAASFSKANHYALSLANTSLLYELASNELLPVIHKIGRRKRQTFNNNLGGFNQDDFSETLQTIDVTSFISGTVQSAPLIDPHCLPRPNAPCDTSTPFRTISGYCNNLQNPTWGQTLTTFTRLLPPKYDDHISRPRAISLTGTALPNPRVISTLIHPDISNLHTRYSLMLMQYAQFLDHDLTLTPIHKGFHESIPSCRKCDSPQTVHPECHPFPVPPGDHYYPELNITNGERLCFPFMRSLPGQQSLGPREQINQNTAFLDSSQIYGENDCVANKLRGFSGRLNSTIHPIKGKELLPQSPYHPECKSLNGLCFIGGDERASEQPGLTTVHTIFLREHNRIVEGLRGVNPHWTGDQLYEHARRIVAAENQQIVYNEFLPRILSWNAVNLYGLKLLPEGYYKEYNPTCNPAIFNEFAAAAFRIGHSLLRPHIPRLSANHQPIDPPLLLRDGFFKMDALLQPGIIDEIARGLVATPMETLDQFITGEVTNHLFEDRRTPFSGVDLIALNIQRGRDHGLQSYNNYRALCNLKKAKNWSDLGREIPPEVISRFKKIYATVDDIDLFPGAMTERPLQGGLVGPTLACIIGIQFRQLRKCDRFWFENDFTELRFTPSQLAEIRKVTLAKIICENLELTGDMQRAAFDLPNNFLNPRIPCHSMPQINLSAWRENVEGCQIGNRLVKIGESIFPSPCTSCVCTTEGSQCASLRVTDCGQLLREWPRDVILRDDVCSSQCGLVLQTNTFSTAAIAGLAPPSQRVSRSRTSSNLNFKLPDLTPFLASL